MGKRILLISGGADVGKSVLIKALFPLVKHKRVLGFFTESVYVDQQRVGFTINGFDGSRYQVAGIDYKSELRLGRYGVDLDLLDTAMRNTLSDVNAGSVYLVDELGKLEVQSDYFCQCLEKMLEVECTVVVSSPLKGTALLTKIAANVAVERIKMTVQNSKQIQDYAGCWLQARLKSN